MIYYVDIDETICEYEEGKREYPLANPVKKNIKKNLKKYSTENNILPKKEIMTPRPFRSPGT